LNIYPVFTLLVINSVYKIQGKKVVVVNKKKAVALYSGGLDSILAIKIILEQNINVIGVQFKTPFIEEKQNDYIERYLGIELIKEDISEEHINLLLNPKHGYGKHINPCIDCRITMFRKAGELMKQKRASFIISGEVLGQRPMTQNKASIIKIGEESGYGQWIVRPLSALLLTETLPEKQKIINRSQLMDIQGRSRKRQIALARSLGIKKYPAPAGGCKLTEPGFAKRMSDLLSKNSFDKNDIELLKVGRHFALRKDIKLVVGRNEQENKKIFSLVQPQDFLFSSKNFKGPVSLLRLYIDSDSEFLDKDKIVNLASRITARYCDRNSDKDFVDINVWNSHQKINQKSLVQGLPQQEIEKYLI
jgi:tRNA-uridine 2-sulfurtransferase